MMFYCLLFFVTDVRMKVVLYHVRRNLVSVLFPTLAFSAIYADWSRTRRYKAAKAQKALAEQYNIPV